MNGARSQYALIEISRGRITLNLIKEVGKLEFEKLFPANRLRNIHF